MKILIASLLLLRVCPYTYLIISVNISLFINFKNFNLHSVRSQQLYLQIRKYFSRYQNFTWPTLIQVMVKLKLHIDILQHISTELTLWSAHQHQLHTHIQLATCSIPFIELYSLFFFLLPSWLLHLRIMRCEKGKKEWKKFIFHLIKSIFFRYWPDK